MGGYEDLNRKYDGMLDWLAIQEQANEMQRTHPEWRRGQALFNALHRVDHKYADHIRGTLADPFYDDSRERIEAFAEAVMNRNSWDAETTTDHTNKEN